MEVLDLQAFTERFFLGIFLARAIGCVKVIAMKVTQIKTQIEKGIRSFAKDECLQLTETQVSNGVQDIYLHIKQRKQSDRLFFIRGNESQEIWDLVKMWMLN